MQTMLQVTHDIHLRSTRYFRLALRWTVGIVALLLIATTLILSPLIFSHAAGTHTATPTAPTQVVPQNDPLPNILRRGY